MIRMTPMTKALGVFFGALAVAGLVTLVSARSPSVQTAAAAARAAFASADVSPDKAQAADAPADDAAPVHVAIVVFGPSQGSSPRIIHIPRAGEPDMRASAAARDEAVASIPDDDEAPPPRHRAIPLPRHNETPKPKRQAAAPAPQRENNAAPLAPHRDATIMQKLKPEAAFKPPANVGPAPKQEEAAASAQPEPPPQRRTDVPPPQLGNAAPVVPPQATSEAPVATEADARLTPVKPLPHYGKKSEADTGAGYGPSVSAHTPPPPVGYTPPSGLSYRSN